MAPTQPGDRQVDKKQLETAITALGRTLGIKQLIVRHELLKDEDESVYPLSGLHKSILLQLEHKPT
jgi:hypothetical protein